MVTANRDDRHRTHQDIATAAVLGGATVVQFRDKDMDNESFVETAVETAKIARSSSVAFIVNDRAGQAVAADADGVHIGQRDMALGEVRKIVGEGMVIGVSASSFAEATLAVAIGADYLGVGPIFATDTKTDASEPIGLAELRRICEAVNIPIVAIGGINEANIAGVRAAGASGAAVISYVADAPDMIEAVRKLKKAWGRT